MLVHLPHDPPRLPRFEGALTEVFDMSVGIVPPDIQVITPATNESMDAHTNSRRNYWRFQNTQSEIVSLLLSYDLEKHIFLWMFCPEIGSNGLTG